MNRKLDALRKRESAVAVVGLGYVGLPVAVAMGRTFRVIGFDVKGILSTPTLEAAGMRYWRL